MDLSQNDILTKPSLFIPEYSSRSEDDERRSTCPLIPSPILEFNHPLAQLPNTPSDIDKGGLSPSSAGTEISSVPLELPLREEEDVKVLEMSEEKRSSTSSSGSSALPETASAQLLHSHNRYLSLATENKCQENGGLKNSFGALTLTKASREYAFLSWNWPLIRKWCFWSVMSATIACVCVIVGYISSIPIKCDPQHKWYQGATIYQVFPASFQDSNHDGVGDLMGFAARAPYLQKIGVRAVRVSYIFPSNSYPENYNRVTNLTDIEGSLGTIEDFKYLLKTLHDRNISVIIDLPLYPYFEELKVQEQTKDDELASELKHVIVNNHILVSSPNNRSHNFRDGRGVITDIIKFWAEVGVDGFYLEGLEELAEDPRLASQLIQWRSELRSHQILSCSSEVLNRMNQSYLDIALETFQLVEFRLDPPDPDYILSTVKSVLNGKLYSKKSNPWPFWTLGSLDSPRLSSRLRTPNMTLAMTALTALLPGSNGLLYGDEIGLQNDPGAHYHKDSLHSEFEKHSVGPMLWTSGERTFTPAHVLPWYPHSSASLPGPQVQSVLRDLTQLRDNSPSIYMSYICTNGIIHPNTVIRDLGDDIISVERSYPRRHTFLLVANLGTKTVTKDLSTLHYGGRALLDHGGPIDIYTSFRSLTLYPAEFVLVKLDR